MTAYEVSVSKLAAFDDESDFDIDAITEQPPLHPSANASKIFTIVEASPTVFLYNIGCGVCSALGDSKMPFLFLVFSSVVNVGLDFLFVCVFPPFPRPSTCATARIPSALLPPPAI